MEGFVRGVISPENKLSPRIMEEEASANLLFCDAKFPSSTDEVNKAGALHRAVTLSLSTIRIHFRF